jgi:hypothetical protein
MYVICVYQPTQVLSMSRLGGAAAVAPLVADMSSEVTISLSIFLSPTCSRVDRVACSFSL